MKEKYYNISGWIFQVGTWLFLILFIVIHKTALIVLCIIAYLLYLLIEFFSPMSRYLCNKSSNLGIYEKVRTYFQTPPKIKWKIECFHYETHDHVKISPAGIDRYTSKERVVTYNGSSEMQYYSARDISGPFNLDCDPNLIGRKYYIKLELKADIQMADPETIADYQYQKNFFLNQNMYKDDFYNLDEKKTIPGMDQYTLVKIGNEDPISVNFFLFFLFTILTFVEFYKIYINCFCIYQKFIIKKIVSTRYNLNLPVYNQKYQSNIPIINLIKISYNFNSSDYNYLNQKYDLNLPSKEEVERYNQNMPNENNNQIPPQNNQFMTNKPMNMGDMQIAINNQNQNSNQIPPQNNQFMANKPMTMGDMQIAINNQNQPNQFNNFPPAMLPDAQCGSAERFNKENFGFNNQKENNENFDKATVVSVNNK